MSEVDWDPSWSVRANELVSELECMLMHPSIKLTGRRGQKLPERGGQDSRVRPECIVECQSSWNDSWRDLSPTPLFAVLGFIFISVHVGADLPFPSKTRATRIRRQSRVAESNV
jgi:hypothetical protein